MIKIRNKFAEPKGLDVELDSLTKQIDEQIPKKVGSDDIEITNSTKGIILTDSDNKRWRLTVNTSGAIVITEL